MCKYECILIPTCVLYEQLQGGEMDKGGEDTLLDTGVERDHFHTFISY